MDEITKRIEALSVALNDKLDTKVSSNNFKRTVATLEDKFEPITEKINENWKNIIKD